MRPHLAGLGITLRAMSQPIDETSAGEFMEGIFASLSQFANEIRGTGPKPACKRPAPGPVGLENRPWATCLQQDHEAR
jgi:hypothetical protein